MPDQNFSPQEEKKFSSEESLQLITKMINQAKNRFSETGTLYLFWGWIIFICCTTVFVMLFYFKIQQAYNIWYVTWLGVIYQIFYLVKKKRRQKVYTYTDEIIGFIWLTFIICAFIIVYILIKNNALAAINPCLLVLYGIPTFLSGVVLKFKALRIGGCICWSLAIAAMFTSYEYQLILLSLAVICAWIIPGYLLRAKFKQDKASAWSLKN